MPEKRARCEEAELASTYLLNDGRKIPRLGFGTYRIEPGEACFQAVASALREGYRLVDTARLYGNEADVGRAARECGRPRAELFVTSKIQDKDHGYERALAAGRKSVERAGLGYLDLLLIHSPGRRQGRIVETYDALLALQKQGLVRSVGVSNFGVEHLKALEEAGRPAPAVNQIEMHPLVYRERRAVIEECARKKILVTAYGSVFSGKKRFLRGVKSTAEAKGRTAAQVLLRWGLQRGFQVIPKSVHAKRIRENAAVFDFELLPAEMAALEEMKGDLDEYWDPLGWPVHLGDLEARSKAAVAEGAEASSTATATSSESSSSSSAKSSS